MSSATTQVLQLLRELQQDRRDYQQVADLLQQQYRALLAADSRLTLQISDRLHELYLVLTASARLRSQRLKTLHLATNAQGMQQFMALLPVSLRHQVSALWQQLLQLAAQCQQQNSRNGVLLSLQLETLSTLQLQTPQSFLYQP
ncbi:flagellar export chaperone FlgN [Pantoea sp. A4]|uniref:flagellar export chaperone FlgN n=1 Tax=Pantoea sp. A4 TaxID=1225184 RepID=UPI00037E0552|nr:flagellar export chaperone FlgN [Pantoea sp. A4]